MQNYYPYPPQGAYMQALPIAGADEAKAAQIPFDGKPYGFMSPAGDKLFVKQFDITSGCTVFVSYSKDQPAPPPRYVTMEDFEALKAELLKGVKAE